MKNILITGPPRCGKSTFIEKLVHRIKGPTTGFFTREIREQGRRKGFSINALDGKEGVLAHEKLTSGHKVGKYGVNLQDIDEIAVPSMIPTQADEVIIIDEVGKMECFSPLFKKALIEALNSAHPVIGSISQKGDKFIQEIKARENVLLITITEKNRDDPKLFSQLLSALTG
jgi:nucleoside-triphosphatase THEP1